MFEVFYKQLASFIWTETKLRHVEGKAQHEKLRSTPLVVKKNWSFFYLDFVKRFCLYIYSQEVNHYACCTVKCSMHKALQLFW